MLLPEQLLNGVILITNVSTGSMGAGFMFVNGQAPDGGKPVFLITCAHVVSDHDGISTTRIALNMPQGGRDSWLAEGTNWTVTDEWEKWRAELGPNWWKTEKYDPQKHTHGDIAAFLLPKGEEGTPWDKAIQGAIQDTFSTDQAFSRERIKEKGVTEGHEVLVMGYAPGGYRTNENWPLVRRGAIGQIAPYKRGLTESLVLDAGIFEGTSGGPVMLLPSMIARGGDRVDDGGLLGMVCATSYRQTPLGWVSKATPTGTEMVPVERQHIGVGYVAPVDAITQVTKKVIKARFK